MNTKLIVTGGPSADMMLATLEELKIGRPSFVSDLRFPDGRQFKIMGEVEGAARDKTEVECFNIYLKQVCAIGDVTEGDRKRTPRRLHIVHYRANIRSGEAYED